MGVVVVIACYGGVLGILVLLAARVRRRGISAPILDVFDQMYRPSQHNSRIEIFEEEHQTAENLTPDEFGTRAAARRRAPRA
ncbi:hypothetical protein [Cryptosporangium sp. NPDC051539]|uniref:hypothetical protein n=1 Tax=Cryptosporangium sp. NPDC051539 TaxID=3363962 RepID=UPI0037AB1986